MRRMGRQAVLAFDRGHMDLTAGITIAAARRLLAQSFRERGLDTPELDARLLVVHALKLDRAALAAQDQRILTAGEADAVAALAARRLAREPVARILGRKEFWGLSFKLDAATLVPRPETETVVEAALAALKAPTLPSPGISAFTRVHSPRRRASNALMHALCGGGRGWGSRT